MHLHQILGKKNGGLSKDDINYLTPPLHFYYFYFETVNFHTMVWGVCPGWLAGPLPEES